MALVGGGGAPNVAGGNPAGTGTGLNYIGNHAFAYSGEITSTGNNAADATMFEFTTGSSYILATIDFADQQVGGDKRLLEAEIDGQVVYTSHFDDSPPGQLAPFLQILIPSYSKFKFSYGMNGATVIGTAVLTGRVYA